MILVRFLYYLGCLSIAQIGIRPVFDTALSDLLFFGSLLAFLPILLVGKKTLPRSLPRNLVTGVTLFVLGTVLSLFWIDDPQVVSRSAVVMIKFTYMCLVWFWLSSAIFSNTEQLRLAVICVAVSCALSAAYGVYDYLYLIEYAWRRTAGMAQHVNQFGATCAIGMTMVLGLLFGTQKRRQHPRLMMAMLLSLFTICGLGLVASKSLGSFAALFAAFLLWLVIKKIRIQYILSLLLVAAAIAGVLIYQQQTSEYSVLDRLQTQSNLQDREATLTMRIRTYEAALDDILDNPVLGRGLEVVLDTGFTVHNSLLKALYESGLLGLVGLVLIYLSAFQLGTRLLRMPLNPDSRQIAESLVLSFTVYFVVGLKEPVLYNRFGWVAVALLLALSQLVRQARNNTAQQYHQTVSSPAFS